MTLNITCVAPWGIWQSSDHRISLATARGQFRGVDDDATPKDFHLFLQNGAAILSFCGLGRIGDRNIMDWARAKLRGEHRTLFESLDFLREKATRQLGGSAVRSNQMLIFSIGAFADGAAFFCQIHNLPKQGTAPPIPSGEFRTAVKRIDDKPTVFITPPGIDAAVSQEDYRLIERVNLVREKKQEDFQDLLAAVNLRASQRPSGRIISPSCTTAFLTPDGEIDSKVHGQSEILTTPTILYGVDLTETLALLADTVRRMKAGEEVDDLDEAHESAARSSTTPEE